MRVSKFDRRICRFLLDGTQAETWSGSRYFSERKMAEMHDAAFRMGAAGEHNWAELEKAARKMLESSLELADSVEAA